MAETLSPMALQRHSPCVGVCIIDRQTGWCLGCGRTRDEVARWPEMQDEARLTCWSELPPRLDKLAVRARLHPWTAHEIGTWAAQALATGKGTWVTGVPGAVAEFPCGPAHRVVVVANSDCVEAKTSDARFVLRLHEKIRAFSFGDEAPIVLGMPRGRAALPFVAQTLSCLGADENAADPAHRLHSLFDFGLGRTYSRFCVRTGREEFAETLLKYCGLAWQEALPALGGRILAENPHRVVESAHARIEVCSRIPPPGAMTPPGAHTHFLPQFLQSGEELPAGLTLPALFAPVAIHYPNSRPN